MPDISRTYKSYGLVTMEILEEKMGQSYLGASCPSIQTGQPRTVSQALLSSVDEWADNPHGSKSCCDLGPAATIPSSHISHMRTLFLLTYQPLPFHNDLSMAGLAGAGLSVLTTASTTTLSLFSGLQALCSPPAPLTLVPLSSLCCGPSA